MSSGLRPYLACAVLLAFAQVSAAGVMTVSDIASLRREDAATRPDCTVTGVVSCVLSWQHNSFVLVDREDPSGPAVYIGGDLPGRPFARLSGSDRISAGDVVRVDGHVAPLMLEPGVVASDIRYLGNCELPVPEERRVADLRTGRFNNRRVSVKGVLMDVILEDNGADAFTELSLSTADGPIAVHVHGLHGDLAALRNAELTVDGVCVPSFNARAEFLRPRVEAFSRESIHSVPSGVMPAFVSRGADRSTGILAWTPDGCDCHLRRLRGEVLYVNARERYFVMQATTGVRVNVRRGVNLPEVGDLVDAEGFPMMSDDCGVLEAGDFRRTGRAERHASPAPIPGRSICEFLRAGDSGEFDCHYRFARVYGRVAAVDWLPDGRAEISVEVEDRRIAARLESAPRSLAARLVDLPLVSLVGVLKVNFQPNVEIGRGLTIADMTLLLRSPDDVTTIPDASSRKRRILRLARSAGLLSLLPLSLLALWMWMRAIRQRARSQAVAEDRRRMAVELHDTIAQHLSGARLLLFSVQAEADALSEESRHALAMTGDILESARREVRDAVLNLQSDEMMVKPLEELLKMIAAKANSASGARVRTHFRALPSEMPSQMKTDLLAVVQEAMTNAVKHGHARRILLLSDPLPGRGRYAISVLNDGEKCDLGAALGPETGHFGLSGMRERAARNGFTLSFGDRDGWMEVRLERRKR